ncbi:MAG: hypothetical protein ACI8ZN_002035 [Bacteroidia bacterium]|jgi:hypothetical protein
MNILRRNSLFVGSILGLVLFAFSACNSGGQDHKNVNSDSDSSQLDSSILGQTIGNLPANDDLVNDSNSDVEWRYLVIGDTSSNYSKIKNKAKMMKKLTGFELLSYDHSYDEKKRKMVLGPDDEMFPGEYYSRRDDEKKLSIEMMYAYKEKVAEDLMVLVFSIENTKKNALTLQKELASKRIETTILPTEMYMGCLH